MPRTLTFLFRNDQVLLLRSAQGRWAGLYNGIGGHLEPGEDPLAAARRELQEEAGLGSVGQQLAGVVTVDTGSWPGIGLFVFVGRTEAAGQPASPAAELRWVPLDRIATVPHVEDLPFLVPRAQEALERGGIFFAAYRYSEGGDLIITADSP